MTRQAAKQKEPELSSTLAAYFHDLSHDSLLSGEEERRATQRIEELEVLAWQKMLSYPRAVPAVLELVEEALAHPDTPLVCPEGSRKDWEADACALRLASASAGKAID